MSHTFRNGVAAGVLGVMTAAGCATNGDLQEVRDQYDTAIAEQRAALEDERAERIAADERLATDLAQLRADMETLRTEFDAQITAVEEGLQFALPIHFEFDDATVREDARPALARFTDVVNRHYAGTVVTVEGFADPAGPTRYNRVLSQRRADAVRTDLIGRGIQAEVRAIGYGEERLVVPGATKADPGAELNRRVVFVIERPGEIETEEVTVREDATP